MRRVLRCMHPAASPRQLTSPKPPPPSSAACLGFASPDLAPARVAQSAILEHLVARVTEPVLQIQRGRFAIWAHQTSKSSATMMLLLKTDGEQSATGFAPTPAVWRASVWQPL